MKSKYIRLTIEIIVWTGFIIFPLILFPTVQPYVDKGVLNGPALGVIITHTLLLLFYYFNYYYALPRYYFTRQYRNYFILIFCSLIIIISAVMWNPNFNPLPSPPFVYAKTAFLISVILRFMMMFLLSMGFASYNRLKKAEEEKLKSELAYLKAQINPHFLFNTLNSIYALASKKSDVAPESVSRLASIMRYVITDATQDMVPLEKEINYVSAYVELEKLRLTSKVKLSYNVNGNPIGKQVSPMLFIPLVENAFKHGVSTVEESFINIYFNINNKQLELKIENAKLKTDKLNNNGLGIENVKKRLNLLYSGKHFLNFVENDKIFSVTLVLTFND